MLLARLSSLLFNWKRHLLHRRSQINSVSAVVTYMRHVLQPLLTLHFAHSVYTACRMIARINADCFGEEHHRIGLCNGKLFEV